MFFLTLLLSHTYSHYYYLLDSEAERIEVCNTDENENEEERESKEKESDDKFLGELLIQDFEDSIENPKNHKIKCFHFNHYPDECTPPPELYKA